MFVYIKVLVPGLFLLASQSFLTQQNGAISVQGFSLGSISACTRGRQNKGERHNDHDNYVLRAAPREALGDIVIPTIDKLDDPDPRVWVPQTECLSFRPLCLCVSQGYYVNLLRFKNENGGSLSLGCHRHSSPVHAYTIKGDWGYLEHDWHASAGSYVFEPPGETHTLVVDGDCDEMVGLFHVTGSLLYCNPDNHDEVIGFDDVFTKLQKAKAWYKECGLGEDYVQQFVR